METSHAGKQPAACFPLLAVSQLWLTTAAEVLLILPLLFLFLFPRDAGLRRGLLRKCNGGEEKQHMAQDLQGSSRAQLKLLIVNKCPGGAGETVRQSQLGTCVKCYIFSPVITAQESTDK